MRKATRITLSFVIAALGITTNAFSQTPDWYSAMRWREIGPTRAGRARAVSGVADQPNVAYVGFDNGGVWRSTDYGSTWQPLFDHESTGSIGAIAVAPSNPNIIYVGSGAGIIRPDLATGNGMYKSVDAGKTWTHLGLFDSQMIANVAVDPTNPDRVFVAALGHPYGPNTERGIFRSTDGGKTFEKVLYKDEYTSGNDVVIDHNNPNIVYAALWQQQQSFREGNEFGGSGNGIFKSTDGGTTWSHLTTDLPPIIEANLALAPSNTSIVYAIAAVQPNGARPSTTGTVALYRSDDAGEHWRAVDDPTNEQSKSDARPLARIGGGDLPTLAVDPKNPDVVYSASVVMWRSLDGGHTWSAVRGAPGGDDYQKIWINPNNPDILFVVADQGAVVSSNRGASWSNWYTQPTGAMYHVTTDNAFPYRVCAGQQDSGSACVDSRSMDGEITFHDWHPANIQEYGMAAPDPRNPDLVFGGMRNNVSLWNRKTGQTTYVGPDMGPPNGPYNRNVRTMPIEWSPVNPDVLFYTSDAVWKTLDRGHSWTRISGDLSRRAWSVPASAGKYASSVQVTPQGVITALAPSPRSINVLWAGTDDGVVQMTNDGGLHWSNVTPPGIKPWTRFFNIDAGHFDSGTAYAAANTMRVDDMNPHFFRTHDGGKTWTEIDNGIAPGATSDAIREDPRTKGLLYAATETQVWVSFDDGDHWHSLRLNMPAISVRDIQIKDDSLCGCADLIAGTHGRGFWILDDVSPLRQAAAAQAAKSAYLFKPLIASRVRFATNDPTPWPPELPAGDNPPPGGVIDYYLANNASGPVTLDILDAAGKVIRSYSSDDPVLKPDPGEDGAEYNHEICENDPDATDCDVPIYWAAPQMILGTTAGMHRFSWDLKFDPITRDEPRAEGDATGAVPHRTYPSVNAPWAPPGHYTVRLTVNGQHYTQPLTLRLDPRVHIAAAGLAQLNALSRELYDDAVIAEHAYQRARGIIAGIDTAKTADVEHRKAEMDSIAPATVQRRGRGFGGQRAPAGPPTLSGARDALLAAAMAMQGAEVTPTAREVDAANKARAMFREVMSVWHRVNP